MTFMTTLGTRGYLALDFLGVEEINEDLESAHVPDGQLARLLGQVEVPHRAQRDDRRRLVTTL